MFSVRVFFHLKSCLNQTTKQSLNSCVVPGKGMSFGCDLGLTVSVSCACENLDCYKALKTNLEAAGGLTEGTGHTPLPSSWSCAQHGAGEELAVGWELQ